jgi:small subunit ribosomal protein S4
MITPKEKRERSLGEHLGLKAHRCQSPKCALVRKPYRPGVHGKSRRRKTLSDFGRQIQEKQKFKLTYGINERSLRNVFEQASQKKGSTSIHFIELLEYRLDNILFRLGFAGSRSHARQLAIHGHVLVNKKKVRSPGYLVSKNDVVSLRPESIAKPQFKDIKEALTQYVPPVWLALDKDKLEGKVIGPPEYESVPFEVNLVVESFSK